LLTRRSRALCSPLPLRRHSAGLAFTAATLGDEPCSRERRRRLGIVRIKPMGCSTGAASAWLQHGSNVAPTWLQPGVGVASEIVRECSGGLRELFENLRESPFPSETPTLFASKGSNIDAKARRRSGNPGAKRKDAKDREGSPRTAAGREAHRSNRAAPRCGLSLRSEGEGQTKDRSRTPCALCRRSVPFVRSTVWVSGVLHVFRVSRSSPRSALRVLASLLQSPRASPAVLCESLRPLPLRV
jgi:hypothetical protein